MKIISRMKPGLQRSKNVEVIPHKKGKKVVPPSTPKVKKSKTSAQEMPEIVENLDLSGGKGKPSLRDFYAKYVPSTNMERNLIFCYYLKHIKEEPAVTVNHVFTCYRNIPKLKVPNALSQSLRDTANDKKWINVASLEDIQVPIAGTNYIEHDMKTVDSEPAK